MKPKKIRAKLFLNKKTIADLNGKEMGHLKGGCNKTGAQSGCIFTNYTCLAETCPTDCVISCEGLTCEGTYPDCPCPFPRTE